jgi:hypothetical protein
MTNAQSKHDIVTEVTKSMEKINKEHELAGWLQEQQQNYHPDISKSKGMLRNPECHKLYTEFINDPKYSKYLYCTSVRDICSICDEEYEGYGHNPYPVTAVGRCCDRCNGVYVIPERLNRARQR